MKPTLAFRSSLSPSFLQQHQRMSLTDVSTPEINSTLLSTQRPERVTLIKPDKQQTYNEYVIFFICIHSHSEHVYTHVQLSFLGNKTKKVKLLTINT